MAFRFETLEIPDLVLVDCQPFGDERGLFCELYKRSVFVAHGIGEEFVQDNVSASKKGVLRGLHYQKPPRAQDKLVMTLRGEIFDVAVDMRRGSPTYGRWLGMVLSAGDHRAIYVPSGFAHGFCVLSEEASVVYKVTQEYSPEFEYGIIWNDPEIGIHWPIECPILSGKDSRWPTLREAGHNFEYRKELK